MRHDLAEYPERAGQRRLCGPGRLAVLAVSLLEPLDRAYTLTRKR